MKLQKMLYTNNSKDTAELLYDRPVLMLSSDKNKPECRGRNISLWRKEEQQLGPNGLFNVEVLVLLFYTSSLPVDRAHWIEDPHYAFQWLDQSEYKKSSDELVLIFSKRAEQRNKDKLFKRTQSSKDDDVVVEPVNLMSAVPTWSSKSMSTVSSVELTRSNRSGDGSLDKSVRERQVNTLNRFGYSELKIRFMDKRDRKAFLDVWKLYVKPLDAMQEPFLYHSQGERSAVKKLWLLNQAEFSDFSRERISQMPSDTVPNSPGDESDFFINPPNQASTLKVESGNDDGIWSVVSEISKDDGELHLSQPNIRPDQWRDETISGIVVVLVTNDVLTPLYQKALQLVPKDPMYYSSLSW
jgi:hypothetical protein